MRPVPLEVTMMKRIGELNADLQNCFTAIRVKDDENAFLKAEVEQLMIFCNCTLIPNKLLQAQVERLTKAGDAMADMVDWEVSYERRKKLEADWNAAKEGKKS
jgi:hypothetical protein